MPKFNNFYSNKLVKKPWGYEYVIYNSLNRMARFNMGECKNDRGGYFIIDGKEKVIISQEKFADNTLYIRDKVNELYSHSAEIRTVSEDASNLKSFEK